MHVISSVCATDPPLPYTSIAKKQVNKIVSAPTKSAQINPLSFKSGWLGQTGRQAPLPAEELAAAVSSHRLPHCISSARVARRPRTGLKRFHLAFAHISANIPGQTACHTPAGAEAGLSNLSGKQKFLKKTIAFVAHFPFSHRLLPIVGGISQMVAC